MGPSTVRDTTVSSTMDADDNVMTAFSLPIWAKELSRQGVIAAAQKLRRENILQFDDADQDAIEKIVHRDRLSQHQHNNLQQRVASKAKLRVSTKAKEPRPRTRTEPVLVTAPATSGLPERCPSTYNSPSALGFRHCAIHFERARQLLHHPETEKWQEELNWLRGSVKTPEHLWILDTESCLFTYACPMAFEVCFRAYNGNANLRGPVDYDGASVDQLISRYRALCPPGYQLPKETESRSVLRVNAPFTTNTGQDPHWLCSYISKRKGLGYDVRNHAGYAYTQRFRSCDTRGHTIHNHDRYADLLEDPVGY
jgi:hypothetical protein